MDANMRRTKILATLGPASERPDVLTAMLENGLNAVRCNFRMARRAIMPGVLRL